MSTLWDLSRIQPRLDVVVPGDTIAAMFWNAVTTDTSSPRKVIKKPQ